MRKVELHRGDRVRVKTRNGFHGGRIGTITGVSTEWPGEYRVTMDDPCTQVYDADELEIIGQAKSEGETK